MQLFFKMSISRVLRMFLQFTAIPVLAMPVSLGAEIGPGTLAERLAEGESIALIDIRGNNTFRDKHVPGAMNMPERIFNPERLPTSRTLVVYDDGLGYTDAAAVVAAARESGHGDVFRLRGGLAAWESAGLPVTGEKGFRSEQVPAILYDDLVSVQGVGIALLDVRDRSGGGQSGAQPLSDSGGLTDLDALLPQARVLGRPPSGDGDAVPLSGPASPVTAASAVDPEAELIVVIDNGDGSGEDVVRRIRASGNRRVVLLTGGERILSRDGRPGLERRSLGIQVIDASEIENEQEGELQQ